ncbi:MAG: ion transporter [Candidatus Altiarchaeota archaeon]
MRDGGQITWRHLLWDVVVFTAAVVSVVSVSLEFMYELDEGRLIFLYVIDITALCVFIADLWFLWRGFNGPLRVFLYRNWLDVLSAVPVFRIFRVARFARFLKLARLRRLGKLKRVPEFQEKVKEKTVG